MSAKIGGAYGALLAKKKKGASSGTDKPKVSKVISLSDTKEKKTGNQKKKEEPKKEETKAPKKEEEPTKEQTKRELKSEQNKSDRHQSRSGIQRDHYHKTDEVADQIDAEEKAEKISKEQEEREREKKEREEREAAEARKITLADYEKQQAEKKAELKELNKTTERKVDTKAYSKFVTIEKKNDESLQFTKKETSKPADQKDKKAAAPAASKKGKFVKADIKVGFYTARNNQSPRPPRKDREDKPKPAARAAPAAPAAPVEVAVEN